LKNPSYIITDCEGPKDDLEDIENIQIDNEGFNFNLNMLTKRHQSFADKILECNSPGLRSPVRVQEVNHLSLLSNI